MEEKIIQYVQISDKIVRNPHPWRPKENLLPEWLWEKIGIPFSHPINFIPVHITEYMTLTSEYVKYQVPNTELIGLSIVSLYPY